ncbi:hypothetical protein ECEC4402_3793, partial [Escherichia coli EC4402]
MNSFTNASV